MAINVSGISFFMPIFSFLFVFLIIYALLAMSKVLGESKFIHVVISFIVSIVFMSFSSAELFVRTIIPWFVILVIVVFFILLIAGFSTKSLDKIMTPAFAWVVIAVLGIIFLVSAIYVFNPFFHPDLIVAEGAEGPGVVQQVANFLSQSSIAGGIILLIVAIIVSWVITRK
jgi:hypothetical protein